MTRMQTQEKTPEFLQEVTESTEQRTRVVRFPLFPAVKLFLGWVALVMSWALPLAAAESESMADRTLRNIAEKQREIFADAEKKGERLGEEAFRVQVQSLVHEYERLLRDNPKFALGHAAYGALLGKVGMRKESAAMLLKANQLDQDIPFVKNQLGNYL
eukprot:gene65451-89532_t